MKKNLNYLKILILIGIVVIQLFSASNYNLIFYVVLLLGFILNHQIRKYLKKDSLYIISIFIDIAISSYLAYEYSITNTLLIFISLIDSIFTERKIAVGSTCAISITFVLLNVLFNSNYIYYNFLFYFVFFGLLVIIKIQFNQNSQLNYLYDDIRNYSYELERAKSQIEQYSKEVSELSKIRERNRIAEEIHDSIGHQLTSLLYRLQACQIAIEQNTDIGLKELTNITESLRENIVLLRDKVKNVEVKSYRSFNNSLKNLIEDFSNNIPFKIELIFEGQQIKLTPDQETVLFNNIREALTNIARHSTGDNVLIKLMYELNKIVLIIKDNGIPSTSIKKGYGLRTMENRTELINGKMEISTNNGFKLTFVIPL